MSPSRARTMASHQPLISASWAITRWPTAMSSQVAGKPGAALDWSHSADRPRLAPADRRASIARQACRRGFARPAARSHGQSSTTGQAVVSWPAQPGPHRRPCRRPGSSPWRPWPRGRRGLPGNRAARGLPASSRPSTISSGPAPFVSLVMTVLQECRRGPVAPFADQ